MRRCFATCLGVALGVAPAQAQTVDYETYELDNGLSVILAEDHSPPIVTVSVTVSTFEAPRGAVRPTTIRVTEGQEVTVPAGTFSAFKLAN
jgi:hypothetical protein